MSAALGADERSPIDPPPYIMDKTKSRLAAFFDDDDDNDDGADLPVRQ